MLCNEAVTFAKLKTWARAAYCQPLDLWLVLSYNLHHAVHISSL
jgi:hypothetical protein